MAAAADKSIDSFAPQCPYCGVVLPKRPERKTKCKGCGNPIFVKMLPTTRERILATEAQAQAIEAEWAKLQELASLESKLREWNLSIEIFRERCGGVNAGRPRDVVWGMLNEDLQTLMRQGDLQTLKVRYYEMALFVAEEDRDPNHLLRVHHEIELRMFEQSSVITRVQISTAGPGNACAACLALEGAVLSIEEARRERPIPCPTCSMVVVGTRGGFCRCSYVPVLD